jgi:hypothetical protein
MNKLGVEMRRLQRSRVGIVHCRHWRNPAGPRQVIMRSRLTLPLSNGHRFGIAAGFGIGQGLVSKGDRGRCPPRERSARSDHYDHCAADRVTRAFCPAHRSS